MVKITPSPRSDQYVPRDTPRATPKTNRAARFRDLELTLHPSMLATSLHPGRSSFQAFSPAHIATHSDNRKAAAKQRVTPLPAPDHFVGAG